MSKEKETQGWVIAAHTVYHRKKNDWDCWCNFCIVVHAFGAVATALGFF